MNGPFRTSFVSLAQEMSNHQDRRQAPLSFEDLRDLSSQIKEVAVLVISQHYGISHNISE